MRQIHNITMSVKCNKDYVLDALKKNRENHIKIVKEAKNGYLKEAEKQLKSRLEKIKNGYMTSLSFDLLIPADHTDEYDTIIKMLEMHTDDTIELSADEVRQLIENKWSWMNSFLSNNACYSKTASDFCVTY